MCPNTSEEVSNVHDMSGQASNLLSVRTTTRILAELSRIELVARDEVVRRSMSATKVTTVVSDKVLDRVAIEDRSVAEVPDAHQAHALTTCFVHVLLVVSRSSCGMEACWLCRDRACLITRLSPPFQLRLLRLGIRLSLSVPKVWRPVRLSTCVSVFHCRDVFVLIWLMLVGESYSDGQKAYGKTECVSSSV